MYIRAATVLALAQGALAAKQCIQCTNNVAITDLNDNGDCWFTSGLDDTATTGDAVACTGACFVKYTSKDGILQTVERGCIDAAATTTATQTTIEFLDGAETGADLGTATMCTVDTTSLEGGAITVARDTAGSSWDPNLDVNRLTDMTCAKTCAATDNDISCNAGNNFEVETLTDCGAQCRDSAVCVCDHWTGVITHVCGSTTERPVLSNGFYTCEPYTCSTDCTLTTAACVGTGLVGSSGACACTNAAQFFDGSDAAAPTCVTPTCSADCATATANTGTAGAVCTGNASPPTSATGSCVCNNGGTHSASANTCTATVVTATNPMCLQCSSDTEGTDSCASGSVTATECAGAADRCAAVSTLWVDSDGNSVREVVERGCTTDAMAYDTCEFNVMSATLNAAQGSLFTDATEISCRYVCDTATDGAGCNSELADGIDSRYVEASTCNVGAVCDSLDSCKAIGDFTATVAASLTPTTCAAVNGAQAKCVGVMKYMDHMRFDGQYERAMVHLEYMCATTAMDNAQSCTTATVGTSQSTFATEAQTNDLSGVKSQINVHTCTTVCDSDNCNNAWPGQPKCITCAHDDTDAGTGALLSATDADHCYTNVGVAAACPQYFDNACFVTQTGLDLTSNWAQMSKNPYSAMQSMGAYRSISRGCTQASEAATVEGTTVSRDEAQNQMMHMDRMVVCKEDGCNFGPALPTPDN